MKRIIAFVLTFLLAFSLCACTSEKPADKAGGEQTPQDNPVAPDNTQKSEGASVEIDDEGMIYDLCFDEYSYTDETGNLYDCYYKLPVLGFHTEYCQELNSEIENSFYEAVKEQEKLMEGDLSLTMPKAVYDSYENGNILSIVIRREFDDDSKVYDVYNIDITTGEKANFSDIAAQAGMSEEMFLLASRGAMGTVFAEKYGGQKMSDMTFYMQQYSKTVSTDNYGVEMPMFLNDKQDMCIIANIYSLAGADCYQMVLDISEYVRTGMVTY